MVRKTAEEKYLEREKAVIGSSTVNFAGPVLKGGKGIIGRDLNGKKFLDFTAQISLLNTGYAPKEVVSAICQMARKLHSCISADWPYSCKIKINGIEKEISRAALAERLIEITSQAMPFPKRVCFEVSGATAVNLALKIAKITYLREHGVTTEDFDTYLHNEVFVPSDYDKFKFSILNFKNAFHGRHGDSQCLTNSKARQLWAASSSCAFGRLPFPSPEIDKECFWNETREIIGRLRKFGPGPIIAFVFEPVQGEGGINVPDGELLAKLVEYLRERHIYIIADEIQTGLGRTGKMFACEHFNIQPDMLLISKSLGAGIPTAAVVVNAEKFPDLEPGMHSGSHHSTPLAVAGAIANIDLILEQKLVERSANYGHYAMIRLKNLAKSCSKITEVRGLGLMIGIEFTSADYRDKVVNYCREHNLLLAPAGARTIRMTPALVVTIPQIDQALSILQNALDSLE